MRNRENERSHFSDAAIQKAGTLAVDTLSLEDPDFYELAGRAMILDYELDIIQQTPKPIYHLDGEQLREKILHGTDEDRVELVRTMQRSETIYISAARPSKNL